MSTTPRPYLTAFYYPYTIAPPKEPGGLAIEVEHDTESSARIELEAGMRRADIARATMVGPDNLWEAWGRNELGAWVQTSGGNPPEQTPIEDMEPAGLPHFPYMSGDHLIIGPQAFTDANEKVINWRGANYVYADSAALIAVANERARHPELGYTAEHDDEQGTGHLFAEVVNRLTHPGETPTPGDVRYAAVTGAAILLAAIDVIDRQG